MKRVCCGSPKTLICFQVLSLFLLRVWPSSPVSSESLLSENEKWVLLQFKDSVSDPHGILSAWDSESDHCSWPGVSCGSDSRVSSLNITGNGRGKGNHGDLVSPCSSFTRFPFYGFGIRRTCENKGRLRGKLSPVIGKLTQLRVLSLPFNDFSGQIPLEIWSLGGLEVIDLEGNSFAGKLPRDLTGLKKLRVINLGFNRLVGEIPSSLSVCLGLQVLNLAGNQLNGAIPGIFGAFPSLRGLYLSFNRLSGMVLDTFGNACQNLEHLDLSGNLLNGGIPRTFGNCTKLKTLLLFSNTLHGYIPWELGQLQKLEVLDVSRNSLCGPIPSKLGGCVSLSVLVLSNPNDFLPARSAFHRLLIGSHMENNHFQGSIPREITSLPMLRILWAPMAALEGEFPSSWGDCRRLEMVNLAQNHFTSEISGFLQGCKNLRYLNLSSNKLTGKLDENCSLPCMVIFDVSGNLMTGSIPTFNYSNCCSESTIKPHFVQSYDLTFPYLSIFMHVTRLKTSLPFSSAGLAVIHNFSGNKFTGLISWLPIAPQRLKKRTEYAFLAGGNNLSGTFPEHFFRKCSALNALFIDISKNRISGQISSVIGRMCSSLKFLDASENEISGSIPESIGDIESLLVVNLSGNKLEGQVPVGLSRLKNLKRLSLVGNNLTGIVPFCFQKLLSLEVLELPPNLFLNAIPHEVVNMRRQNVLLDSSENMNFSSLRRFLLSPEQDVDGGSKNNAPSLSGNNSQSRNCGLTSIEIASIISGSVIAVVLIGLAVLLLYTRKWMPKSRVQVTEMKEITVFIDPGVPLTFDNIAQATSNFSYANCIGNGGFGATYKAEISPGILVAVKRLSVGRFVQGVPQFHAEIKTLGRIRHPNLVTLIGYHASQTEMFLIYNFFPGGNLENFIQKRSATTISWEIIHKIALDIASALTYLHDECVPRILHRDVKPSNILLDNDFNAYLSDFGLSRLLGATETHATTGVAGTFGYVAPEYAMTCRVSEKSDVYSYGVVLLELISNKKALDPSFSAHRNGFNIVSWACMQLRQGSAKHVFTEGLWDTGPEDKLVEMLHLAVRCTAESLSIRPTMKLVVQRLNQLQNPSG